MANSIQAINVGFALLTRISSIPGSPTFTFVQPLINSHQFLAPWVLLGSQILLLLAKYVFQLEKLPIHNFTSGQLLQIPIGELQSLLQYLGPRQPSSATTQRNTINNSLSTADPISFPTELPPDSPLYMAIYISVDYSNELYTPSLLAYVPIISFPGLRGAVPFLILALLAVIFVRCVVPPETTGAKPAPIPRKSMNQYLNLTSEEIVTLLKRFGKYFSSP
ncbi:hypothetical protein Desdi_1907 [Desulfitobacterium dichloroeliminans LMG P-21439]|uniref:Uncharacterized protein n=1 Tax=Desulfitobacterium dichloroeliminans (strain LMG P-21439 / DCA1) TaxID=871963 RepID=L0F9L1_DESDL|nr:hypothetical protein Desdi_1907 [Desulfitobacterium dichloroeliminans LMG P-21439]